MTSPHCLCLHQVELALLKNEPIPSGWLVDGSGQPTTDPIHVQTDGILMPLGGMELHSGYKGSGLGMMVEIFCGILSGKCYLWTAKRS